MLPEGAIIETAQRFNLSIKYNVIKKKRGGYVADVFCDKSIYKMAKNVRNEPC